MSSLSRAIDETEGNPQNLDDSYFAETLDYIVEIHELGICKTNPIQNTNWLKKDNIILWKGKNNISLEVNVGPGKKMPGNITLGKMPYGDYNYSYILLKKTIKAKAKAVLLGQTFFSNDDKRAIGDGTQIKFFNEDIKNFGTNTYYKQFTNEKVEVLLLNNDKKTTSNSDNTSEYILAVYEGKITINRKTKIDVKFSSTDAVTISKLANQDWTQEQIFNCLPPKYSIISS